MAEARTFCRICEAMCGLVATVEDGRLVSVRGDGENPYSQGFMCTKAAGMIEVTYDGDRVTQPLKRVGGPGEFEPVSWDAALEDIARRLSAIVTQSGPDAFASFIGNPTAFSASALIWLEAFQRTVGSRSKYGINGEDAASFLVASALMFGSSAMWPKPDLWRTDFLLMLGANPMVSKGSLFSEPHTRKALDGIVERGGRVVVVDPRRTETARRYEHVRVRPGTDAWFLIALLRTMFDENLMDPNLGSYARGGDELRTQVERFEIEECADRCGVPAEELVQLGRAFATSPTACAYGRTGTCTQQFGTLNNVLQAALNVVTGNLEVPGGSCFGWGLTDVATFAKLSGIDGYGDLRSPVQGLPGVAGLLPSQALAADIRGTETAGRVRALLSVATNPVLSSGAGGAPMEAALGELDLFFSLDLYVNETNRYADYVLPVSTFYERADIPLTFISNMLRPSIFGTTAVVEGQGEVREEWEILDEIARRMGRGGAGFVAPQRWLAKLGVRLRPEHLFDLILRTSPEGDWFGLRRGGLSWRKLLVRHPEGKLLREHLPTRPLTKRLRTKDRKVDLAPSAVLAEFGRLASGEEDSAFPLRLIGLRENRSHNSWMHNVERLVPDGRRPQARVNPVDASALGAADGDTIVIESRRGAITMPILVTDEVGPGTVAIPHGWGHNAGWQRANRAGGASPNDLVSTTASDLESLAAMSVLNGVPIRLKVSTPQDREPIPSSEAYG